MRWKFTRLVAGPLTWDYLLTIALQATPTPNRAEPLLPNIMAKCVHERRIKGRICLLRNARQLKEWKSAGVHGEEIMLRGRSVVLSKRRGIFCHCKLSPEPQTFKEMFERFSESAITHHAETTDHAIHPEDVEILERNVKNKQERLPFHPRPQLC